MIPSAIVSKAIRIFIVLVVLTLVGAGLFPWLSRPSAPSPELVSEPVHDAIPYVRAAHWFGSGWAVNLWNTDLEVRAQSDFSAIKEDGFNTVVLVVPWSGFAPDPRSGELDAHRVERLLGLMRLADRMDLDVIVRVSYAWDSLSQASGERLMGLWLDDLVYRAWLDHLAGLWIALKNEPNLLFGFFSWEDLWAVMSLAEAPLAERLDSAQTSGFRHWLQQRYVLDDVAKRFRSKFDSWSEVPLPSRREPAFKLFLQFLDHAWMERFFRPAQERFPRLSMEIRIDSDPVWDGDSLLEWHGHEAAWNLPGAAWTTLYWSPAMGGENRGELLDPGEAAERLERSLRRVLDHTGGRPIFIGQFLAEDFTPGYEQNGRVPRERIDEFLVEATEPLQRYSAGYGLWTWSDYHHDAIANPEFVAGLDGWTEQNGVRLDENALLMPAGSTLGTILSIHAFHAPGGPKQIDFCIEAAKVGERAARLSVLDGGSEAELGELRFDSTSPSFDCMQLPVTPLLHLRVEAQVDARVSRLRSSGFIQPSGMRNTDGAPKSIAASYRALNERLRWARRLHQPLYEDGWMGLHFSVDLEPTTQSERELRFTTHLPEGWPVRPRLAVAVDGDRIAEVECIDNGAVVLPLVQRADQTETLRVHIESSVTHRPSGDQRDLGCLLAGLQIAAPQASPQRQE